MSKPRIYRKSHGTHFAEFGTFDGNQGVSISLGGSKLPEHGTIAGQNSVSVGVGPELRRVNTSNGSWEALDTTKKSDVRGAKFPSNASPGDLVLFSSFFAKHPAAFIKCSAFGADPLVFYYSAKQASKDDGQGTGTGPWKHLDYSNVARQKYASLGNHERALLRAGTEGARGEILVRRPNGTWTVFGEKFGQIDLECEQAYVLEVDEDATIEEQWESSESMQVGDHFQRTAGAQDNDRLLAGLYDAYQDAPDDPAQYTSWFQKHRQKGNFGKWTGELVGNLESGPTMGTTIPLDMANFVQSFKLPVAGDGGSPLNHDGAPGMSAGASFANMIGSLYGLIVSAHELWQESRINPTMMEQTGQSRHANDIKVHKRDLATHISKLMSSASSGATTLAQAAPGAGAAASIAGSVTGGAGVVLSLLAMYRSARKAASAADRIKLLRRLLRSGTVTHNPDLAGCMEYLLAKLVHRHRIQMFTAIGASSGAIGGALLIVGGFVAAAGWSPAGWAFLGVATIAAIGVGIYLLHRRRTKGKRAKEREQKWGCGDETTAAQKLLGIANQSQREGAASIARAVLFNFGITQEDLSMVDVKDVAAHIGRHLRK
ncbi:MAG: hypothetical protein AAFN27_21240 [Pseudomonadota bacterium]